MMNRKDALSRHTSGWIENGSYNDYSKDEIVNKIYDDFESRICNNCKYADKEDNNDENSCWCEKNLRHEKLTHGCKEWKTENDK